MRATKIVLLLFTIIHIAAMGCSEDEAQETSESKGASASGDHRESALIEEASNLSTEPISPPSQAVDLDGLAMMRPKVSDPILEELKAASQHARELAKAQNHQLRDAANTARSPEATQLVATIDEHLVPAFEDFTQLPHQAPVAQYLTGTCWAFAGTSFFESEAERKTGKPVKLSEMHTVYYEYLAKAEGYLATRGESKFGEGSEVNAVTRMWMSHGAVPAEQYDGVQGAEKRYNHQLLFEDLKGILVSVIQHETWSLALGLEFVRAILNEKMGPPPTRVTLSGSSMSPLRYMREELQINPEEYIEFMSSLDIPFYTKGVFNVPDNWWHANSYHNLPLDVFYQSFKSALESGYTVAIAIDVSEPGKVPERDLLFIPEFDIPSDQISQLSRQMRIISGATTDDHGVHVVGYTRHADADWFLIKDSGRSSRYGAHRGYYMMREDYFRLKVLAFTVHRDAVADSLRRFDDSGEP